MGRALATGSLPLDRLARPFGDDPRDRDLTGVPGGLARQLVGFCVVGVLSTLFYLALYSLFRLGAGAQFANAAALLVSAVANTAANRRLTFGVRGRDRAVRHQAQGLVVFAIGLFTSARIAEQVRSGIQALPRGQRYAGMAIGFTTFQTYRYVLLPMAFRIIIPPLTSETMNIFKNSSVAFAVSVAELTMFAMQAQEETSRGIEVYLAVTTLYIISAFAINRIMAFIEKRARIPGMVVASGAGGGH